MAVSYPESVVGSSVNAGWVSSEKDVSIVSEDCAATAAATAASTSANRIDPLEDPEQIRHYCARTGSDKEVMRADN